MAQQSTAYDEILKGLQPDALEVLRAVKGASLPVRRLALSSSPSNVRGELEGLGLVERDDGRDDGLVLSRLGEGLLEKVDSLDEGARESLEKDAEEAISSAVGA